ncbi:DUF742 domain-containing protein [Actinomadura roseirufa]|uniref:DUF742 domain-containing protein n=1 Tax=Actinomadura roseirufa TaxID=2094049 RepID=UPI0010410391|nr:DUF742 domain-containing protein [Actinomadura roseirufa]
MNDPEDYRDTPLRSYVLTGGRAAPADPGIGVDTLLKAMPNAASLPMEATPQLRALLRLCNGGVLSVAEVSAHLELPVSVVRILAGDLIASGHLHAHAGCFDEPSTDLLKEVLDGLRNL